MGGQPRACLLRDLSQGRQQRHAHVRGALRGGPSRGGAEGRQGALGSVPTRRLVVELLSRCSTAYRCGVSVRSLPALSKVPKKLSCLPDTLKASSRCFASSLISLCFVHPWAEEADRRSSHLSHTSHAHPPYLVACACASTNKLHDAHPIAHGPGPREMSLLSSHTYVSIA